MGDDLKKVRRGEPLRIPASTFNTFIDVARDHRARQHGVTAGAGRAQPMHTPNVLPVRNDTGVDFTGRFRIVGLDEPIYGRDENPAGFDNHIAFKAVTPALPEHAGRFGILLEPVRAGGIGRALVSGVCQVRVSMQADAPFRRFAEVRDDSTLTLRSNSTGSATVLWSEEGTGTRWAIVRLDGVKPHHTVVAKITDELNGRHGWVEQQLKEEGELEDKPDGLSGSSVWSERQTSAYEVNGHTVKADTIVLLRRMPVGDQSGSWQWIWVFDFPMPQAQMRYQVLAANEEDLQWRPDWVRAH